MKTTLRLDHDPPRPGEPLLVRALLTLTADPPQSDDRIPLNLALVLDRSASMSGPKIEAAREAAALAVQRVWPEDIVSVVTYDHEVRVVAEPATGSGHRDLPRLCRSIQPGGMTNLSGGWLKGRELVERHLRAGGVNRVILLTDGRANQGITDPDDMTGLCRRASDAGISTTTIGFGADFDEMLLQALADAGGGATYYIEEPDQAPAVFEEELEGLLGLSAQNVAVEVRPEPSVRISRVRHSYRSTATAGGPAIRLEMGDLYARDPRRLLIELLVDPVPESAERSLARIALHADVLEAEGGVVHRTLALPITLDVEGGARVDPEVVRESLLLDAADARERALERRAEGDFDGAVEVLGDAGRALRDAPIDDEHLGEEAEDLDRMAARLSAAKLEAADLKYMRQRGWDLKRSRGASHRSISRNRKD